jgi:hypothetical protein
MTHRSATLRFHPPMDEGMPTGSQLTKMFAIWWKKINLNEMKKSFFSEQLWKPLQSGQQGLRPESTATFFVLTFFILPI